MSPELLEPEIQNYRRTKSSDCYALGMVIYELLSGHVPFHHFNHHAAAAKILRGEHPERPHGVEGDWLAGNVWEVLERCWTPQPGDRPSIKDILQCLEGVSGSWIPPPPQLLATQPTVGPLTWGFSDAITVGSADGSGVYPSAQVAPPSEKPDPEEFARIVNEVG